MSESEIFIQTSFAVRDAEEFRRLAGIFTERVEALPGLLRYEHYLDDGGTTGASLGHYADSDACIAHRRSAEQELWDEIYAICTVTAVNIFGVPTPALVEDLADYDITWFGAPVSALPPRT
ncbi:MAG: hypothetical protein KDB35_23805, partial [Acidimicrobiales bacterium]|nr:hypothetical protein [Acidimicrobiales bacterium]